MLDWINCDYTGSSTGFLAGIPSEQPGTLWIQCWSDEHQKFAFMAVLILVLYVPTVAIVMPTFMQTIDGFTDVTFSGFYYLLETTFKIVVLLTKRFSQKTPLVYLAVVIVICALDMVLLLTPKRFKFAKCSIPFYTKFKAFFSFLVLFSAVVSFIAGLVISEPGDTYMPFAALMGGIGFFFVLFSFYICKSLRSTRSKVDPKF